LENRTGAAELAAFTPFEDQAGRNQLASVASLNAAFYEPTGELVALDGQQLAQVAIGPRGDQARSGQAVRAFSAAALKVANPQGMAVDAAGGRLFVLDSAGSAIVRVQADAQGAFNGQGQRIALRSLENVALRGIAFNPADGHLYASSPAEQKLYKLSENGQVAAVYDIAELNLRDPQGMVFAPSADQTDDPAVYNLYLADSGMSSENANNGHIIELSFEQRAAPPQVSIVAATVINVIDTSRFGTWNPSSPDPTGITFRPNLITDTLTIVDSEVEETHPDYQGFNVFHTDLDGNQQSPSCTTVPFSHEPTGAGVDPGTGRLFFTDDNNNAVYEVDYGADGICGTGDDGQRRTLNLATFLAAVVTNPDPSGVAYGAGQLFIMDDLNSEVFVIDLGNDERIGGSNQNADMLVTHFDTAAMGVHNSEGIEYSAAGTLFFGGTPSTEKFLLETTTAGAPLLVYDIKAIGGGKRSGLAFGPRSTNASLTSMYVASRGVDSSTVPDQSDGKIYELDLGNGVTPTPTDTATPTITVTPPITPTVTGTSTPGPSPTPTNTSTPGPSPTATNTSTPGPSPTATATVPIDPDFQLFLPVSVGSPAD
jgi:hypothetical protein